MMDCDRAAGCAVLAGRTNALCFLAITHSPDGACAFSPATRQPTHDAAVVHAVRFAGADVLAPAGIGVAVVLLGARGTGRTFAAVIRVSTAEPGRLSLVEVCRLQLPGFSGPLERLQLIPTPWLPGTVVVRPPMYPARPPLSTHTGTRRRSASTPWPVLARARARREPRTRRHGW